MRVELFVLNYNGRTLLEECLPSLLAAAAVSRHACDVVVVDNSSTDDSVAWLRANYPQLRVDLRPNLGLASFNSVLAESQSPVALLLNNDIRLAADAIDPLVAPLEPASTTAARCFLTAPLCWLFDGQTHEGLKTAVTWRWGLVQATSLFPGHDRVSRLADRTASAGAVMAVDREKFLALGGFDELFLPGRLEDLDFCFRGYQHGFEAWYVPAAVAYHKGQATFGREFGAAGCDRLALRNTILFQWKNLRHPWHRARHAAGMLSRLAHDAARAPFLPLEVRWATARALVAAWRRWNARSRPGQPENSVASLDATNDWLPREREFFRDFSFRRMARPVRLAPGGSA
jgi:N-acetylglucosaminyl-diphospho-decaprenol L-rhamnosyltransferase